MLRKHAHHVVHTDLKPGWHDVDIVMLHANFALLSRFVEQEVGGIEKLEGWTKQCSESDPDGLPDGLQIAKEEQIHAQTEAAALYRWWKFTRPAKEAEKARLLSEGAGTSDSLEGPDTVQPPTSNQMERCCDAYKRLEDKMDMEEQEMLLRLMKIRRSLWT